MLAGCWLALAGLPVFVQPIPQAPHLPATMAIATRQVSLRVPCYSLVCTDAEWTGALPNVTPPADAPGVRPTVPKKGLPPQWQSRRLIGLRAPASRREQITSRANLTRIDTTYRLEAIREPDTQVRVEFGTGYRIQPYADYGTSTNGMVARGGVHWSQQLFDSRASFNQRLLVEAGRENAYLRQWIGIDWSLIDNWSLHSNIEIWHDTGADGGDGHTEHTGNVQLRYTF